MRERNKGRSRRKRTRTRRNIGWNCVMKNVNKKGKEKNQKESRI
jgi:hypothetical protein